MDNVDVEFLISLVEARPSLWDKTNNNYKDKHLKAAAWREICCLLFENFEELEQIEQQNIGRLLIKRWTHIRDAWTKSLKKQKNKTASGSAKKPRLYLYHEKMSFLMKVIDMTDVNENTDSIIDDIRCGPQLPISDDNNSIIDDIKDEPDLPISEDNDSILDDIDYASLIDDIKNEPDDIDIDANNQESEIESTTPTRNKKRKLNEFNGKTTKLMEQNMAPYYIVPQKQEESRHMQKMASSNIVPRKEEESRHLTFFRSILPSVLPFDDDETLELQCGVIQLIQKIKEKRRHFGSERAHI
ncbi:uncharacterized protein [Diabrotica undecimpunctata]|uniref:uncharacterized protein n=1 Tax=Diabrotica undecimpunctata TaxID=50387 RepID=UPI003B63782B